MMMKTKIAILLFLVFVLSSKSISYAEPVLDTDGEPLRPGIEYYAVTNGPSGGLSLSPPGSSQSCPYNVIIELTSQNYGHPVTFKSLEPSVTTIGTSVALNMVSVLDEDSNQCPDQSLAWKVSENPSTGKWDVTTGGTVGNPDASASQFQIVPLGARGSYAFTFCPPGCSCKLLSITSVAGDEEARLGVSTSGGGPTFTFKKADHIRIKQVA
ncbi:Proteinase inhibitor I3, Kunitz legume [Corchorus olitorius]|uniref:Proteinase inhibitor I3, Kunitz legume n=1 Tax=Corchorus olitorius TaxID=93759 RepID=A0A1R3JCZ4_9ROSI|nr:Proteinase inhibitor I3, Kunitz legume [Corchorus olitorius]